MAVLDFKFDDMDIGWSIEESNRSSGRSPNGQLPVRADVAYSARASRDPGFYLRNCHVISEKKDY